MYYLGCETLRNCLVKPQGPAKNRPGLRHVAEVHAIAGHPGLRLLDFVFNDQQKYIVALYHLGAKVYRDNDLALVATLTLPYHDTELPQVDYVQIADTMRLAHPGYPLRQVTRDTGEVWGTAEYEFTCPPQHQPIASPGEMKIHGTLSAGDAVTLEAVNFPVTNAIFTADMEGEVWVLAGARVAIGAFIDTTNINAVLTDAVSGSRLQGGQRTENTDWSMQAANDARGYFRSVAYYQSRLWLGGTATAGFQLWASRSNAPYDFQVTSTDDNMPMRVPVSPGRADAIRYLVAGSGGLEVFTEGAEGYVPSPVDQPVTPKTIQFIAQTAYGSRYVKPVRIDAQTLFAQRDEGAIRLFIYSNISQTYAAEPVTVRAPHLVDDPVSMTAVAGGFGLQADFLLVVNADGTGAMMTSEPSEQVKAWADLTAARTLLDVRAARSRIYVATRTGAGHFLELFDSACIFDSQKDEVADPPAKVWTGFDHLAGQAAQLWADGYWRGAVTINGAGGFTTAKAFGAVSVGNEIDVRIRPMPPEMEQQSLMGLSTRAICAHVMYRYSAGLRVGGQKIPDRPFNLATTTAPTPRSDVSKRYLQGGWRRDGQTAPEITREGPFPFEIQALKVEYEVGS